MQKKNLKTGKRAPELKRGKPVLVQRVVRHLVAMAERVVQDADARHRQISKGQLVYGDCYAVHHENIYDLENAIKKLKAEMPNDKLRHGGENQ
jgi:hypothetical protein